MWSLTLPRETQLVLRSERHIVISCEMVVEDAILVYKLTYELFFCFLFLNGGPASSPEL